MEKKIGLSGTWPKQVTPTLQVSAPGHLANDFSPFEQLRFSPGDSPRPIALVFDTVVAFVLRGSGDSFARHLGCELSQLCQCVVHVQSDKDGEVT